MMLYQHKVCVYKGKGKLQLLITCENFVDQQFLFYFVFFFFFLMWTKKQSRGFREGRWGYSKHNFFRLVHEKKNQLKDPD